MMKYRYAKSIFAQFVYTVKECMQLSLTQRWT